MLKVVVGSLRVLRKSRNLFGGHRFYEAGLRALLHVGDVDFGQFARDARPLVHVVDDGLDRHVRVALHQSVHDLGQKLQVGKVGRQVLHVGRELRQNFLLEPALLPVAHTENGNSTAGSHFEQVVEDGVVIQQRRGPLHIDMHVEGTAISVLIECVLGLEFVHRLLGRQFLAPAVLKTLDLRLVVLVPNDVKGLLELDQVSTGHHACVVALPDVNTPP